MIFRILWWAPNHELWYEPILKLNPWIKKMLMFKQVNIYVTNSFLHKVSLPKLIIFKNLEILRSWFARNFTRKMFKWGALFRYFHKVPSQEWEGTDYTYSIFILIFVIRGGFWFVFIFENRIMKNNLKRCSKNFWVIKSTTYNLSLPYKRNKEYTRT